MKYGLIPLLALACIFGYADEEADEHVEVGSRSEETVEEKPLKVDQPQFKLASAKVEKATFKAVSYYPISSHWVNSISAYGNSVELEDGSHWEVPYYDNYVMGGWRVGDTLVITPHRFWFSNYDYYITNKSTNTYVRAKLTIGPIRYGSYSHWIVGTDPYLGHIYLENGMVWCLSPADHEIFRSWAIDDHIIFGVNDSWFTSYDTILINVNMNNAAQARQY